MINQFYDLDMQTIISNKCSCHFRIKNVRNRKWKMENGNYYKYIFSKYSRRTIFKSQVKRKLQIIYSIWTDETSSSSHLSRINIFSFSLFHSFVLIHVFAACSILQFSIQRVQFHFYCALNAFYSQFLANHNTIKQN